MGGDTRVSDLVAAASFRLLFILTTIGVLAAENRWLGLTAGLLTRDNHAGQRGYVGGES